jgi:hypothetical protein
MGKSKEEIQKAISEDAAKRADRISLLAIMLCFGMLVVSALVFALLPDLTK